MMGILVPETCWGNKTAYFVTSSWSITFTMSMMHGHTNINVFTGVPREGVWGVQTPPEIIPKFWQSRAEFPVPWKIHLKNLIIIQVSPTCKFGGTPDWRATAPRSLFSLPSVNWISWTPPKKISGYATMYYNCILPFNICILTDTLYSTLWLFPHL
jgi:hypothetical protein